jgi:predicted phage-related endonuclease
MLGLNSVKTVLVDRKWEWCFSRIKRRHEDTIADTWQYWDGTDDGYINNQKVGKIIRKCRNVNGMIVNPDYPWLFASLDRLINKEGGMNMLTGEPLEEESVLECKNLSYWSARVWEAGMPLYFISQLQTYMVIFDVKYAEIAILLDGNDFKVECFNRDDNLCEQMIRMSKTWWHDLVIPAKEAIKNRDLAALDGNTKEVEKQEAIIQSLEPPPDDTDSYREFKNKRFLKEREKVLGTLEQFALCRKDEMLRKLKGRIDKERKVILNTLVRDICIPGAEVMDFEGLGKFTYTLKTGAKNRTPLVNLKEKPSEDRVEEEFNKLDLDY